MSKLKDENRKLRDINESYRKNANMDSQLMEGSEESQFKKRTMIFDRKSASDSKKSSSSYSDKMSEEMDP